jgi:hypothetical protein
MIDQSFVQTGAFMEGIPWLVGYNEHGKIIVVGKGEAPVSFTSVGDISGASFRNHWQG